MANRMIKLRRPGYPQESNESCARLMRANVLDRSNTATTHAKFGFRSIMVDQYQELDLARVRIEHRLDDLLAFSKPMLLADPTP